MRTLNPSDGSPEPNAATRPACSEPWQAHIILAAREIERVCQRSVSEKALLGGLP